jgi:hypothetical protein
MSEVAANIPARQVRPRVRLGLVGARNTAGADDWLRERLHEIWQHAADSTGFPLRLICGMAHGTDRLAVDSFLDWRDSNAQVDAHEVLAIYPCDPVSFRDLSGVDDADPFNAQRQRLLQSPHCAELVLDGRLLRSAEGTKAELAREKRIRAAAHTYKSEVLIRQSEFLIAVLDRSKEGDVGGTRDTVSLAMALDTPVLVLDPASLSCFVLRHAEELRPQYEPASDSWRDEWKDKLRKTVLGSAAPAQPHSTTKGLESAYDGMPAAGGRVWDGWEKFQNTFKEYAKNYFAALLAHAAAEDERVLAQRSDPPVPAPAAPPLRTTATVKTVLRAIAAAVRAGWRAPESRTDVGAISVWRRQISERQLEAMACYRWLFLANNLLGLGAVLLALTALAILAMTGMKPGIIAVIALGVLTLVKLFLVGSISDNTHRAEHEDFSGTATGLRYIVERLRVMPVMLRAGSARVDLLHQTPRRGRAHDIAEDLCRRIPLADCAGQRDSSKTLGELKELVLDQRKYHWRVHATMQVMHRLLEHAVKWAGAAVLWIVAFDLILLAGKFMLKMHWLDACLGAERALQIGTVLGYFGVVAVALTALLPALMASLNAILFQSQAEQLAERHGAMAKALGGLAGECIRLEQDLKTSRFETSGSHAVLALAERTAGLMAEEVAEWATMYRQGVHDV